MRTAVASSRAGSFASTTYSTPRVSKSEAWSGAVQKTTTAAPDDATSRYSGACDVTALLGETPNDHDVRLLRAIAGFAQHAHVALMTEELGHDGAEHFVVAGYVYHDHRNSLLGCSWAMTAWLALCRLARPAKEVDELAAALTASSRHA